MFEALSTVFKAFSKGFFLRAPRSTRSSRRAPVSLPYPITCSRTSDALIPAFCILPQRVLLFAGLLINLLAEPPPNTLFHQELLFEVFPPCLLFTPLLDGNIPFADGAVAPNLFRRF